MARSPNGSPARSKVAGAVLGPAWTVSAREASAVTQAAGEKNHELPTQPEAAADSKGRITPALWMPAAPAIAWLAFSSAETDWDAKFYLGASIWYAAAPDSVLDWLHDIEEHCELLDDFEPSDFQHLHRHIRNAAAQTASLKAAKAERAAAWVKVKANRDDPKANKEARRDLPPLIISKDHIRGAARTLRADLELKLEGEKPAAQRDYDAIWEASDKLRRALADGNLTACGWPGRGPDFSDNNATLPLREPIPRDVFSRPVTISQAGVLAFTRGDDSFGYDHDVLWSGLLFQARDLLALHTPPEDDRPSVPYTPPDRGGIDPKHDWPPFDEECRKHLQKLRDNPPDGDLKRALTQHMQWWAPRNMKTAPIARTIRGRAKDVFLAVTKAQPSPDKK